MNDAHSISAQRVESDAGSDCDQRLLVKGSVLFGSGLEPLPVGLFILTETNSTEVYGLNNDEDDEDDEDAEDDEDNNENEGFYGQLFFDSDNAFQ